MAEAVFDPEETTAKHEWLKRMRSNLKTWGPNTFMQEIVKYQEAKKDSTEQLEKINEQAEYFKNIRNIWIIDKRAKMVCQAVAIRLNHYARNCKIDSKEEANSGLTKVWRRF